MVAVLRRAPDGPHVKGMEGCSCGQRCPPPAVFNPHPGSVFQPSMPAQVQAFRSVLIQVGAAMLAAALLPCRHAFVLLPPWAMSQAPCSIVGCRVAALRLCGTPEGTMKWRLVAS